MHFLTKLLNDKIDEEVHRAFIGYSQGKFPGPKIQLNLSKKNIRVRSGPYYGKFILEFISFHLPANIQVIIDGIIESASNLKELVDELNLGGTLQKKKGIHIWKGEATLTGSQLKQITDTLLTNNMIFLDIELANSDLPWTMKTKKKISKGQLQKAPDTKFASGVFNRSTDILNSLKQMLYPDLDIPVYSKLVLTNEYIIENLEIPDDPDMDPRTKRLQTRRKGILNRTAIVTVAKDTKKEIKSQKQFSA